MLKRIIIFILIFIIFLSSCGGTAENVKSDAATSAADNTVEIKSEFIPVGGINYEGYNFRILGYDGQARGTWYAATISEIFVEETTGDPINDSVWQRNRTVEALYNIEIGIVPVTYPNRGDFATLFSKGVLAGDDLFDAAFLLGSGIPQILGQKNMTYDLLTIPALDLSKSWWDKNSIADLSIGGKLNMVIGDVNLYSAFASVVVFANKQIIQDYEIENLYQLVRDNKWTWSKMHEISKIVSRDLNGDNIYDFNDQLGLVVQQQYMYDAAISAGGVLTPKNKEDIPELKPNTEKIISIIDSILQVFIDKECTIFSPDVKGFNNVHFEWSMPKFKDGEIMFIPNQLMFGFDLRGMDSDFAILPLPKYSETEKNYGTVIQPSWGTFTVIPVTCADTEMTANILQALGYYAQQEILPAYYDKLIKNKIMRDEESAEMLDLISANIRHDLSLYYAWGNMVQMFIDIVNSRANTFESSFAKIENIISAAIQKTLDELQT
ncbi:MAG: hypothetical protein FWF15_10505 [Oscillospiraceae bacterium]|nr:hypothetical protein [Oscillospiraceae bacterium]